MAGQKGMRRYPVEIRIKAIKMFFEEGYRKKDIPETLSIKNDTQLEGWLNRLKLDAFFF